MKKSPFLDDQDFFKSNELSENGELLTKAIPEMKKEPPKKIGPPNAPPKIAKFKKETETMFSKVDVLIKEIIEKKGLTRSKNLIEKYTDFKSELQYCLNDMIHYGSENNESGWDKTRININK